MPKETPKEKMEVATLGARAWARPLREAAALSALPCESASALRETRALRVGMVRVREER
jgi:hypothetical protein